MTALGERIGASLRRAPYVWAVLTLLLYLLLSQPASAITKTPANASTGVAIAASGLIALGVLWSVLLVPSILIPRMPLEDSEDRIAFVRWGFTGLPVAIGLTAVALGGQPWAFVLGSVVSMALAVQVARGIRREVRSG